MGNMRRVKVSYWTVSGEGSIFIPPEKKVKKLIFWSFKGVSKWKIIAIIQLSLSRHGL